MGRGGAERVVRAGTPPDILDLTLTMMHTKTGVGARGVRVRLGDLGVGVDLSSSKDYGADFS